jgi:hypothetical protein
MAALEICKTEIAVPIMLHRVLRLSASDNEEVW